MSSVTTSHICDLLVGELSSTLGASSLKNFSAVSGSHSFSKAMFLFSLSFLRLVCSLHDSHLLVKLINVRVKIHPTFRVFIRKQNTLYNIKRLLSSHFRKLLYFYQYNYIILLTLKA